MPMPDLQNVTVRRLEGNDRERGAFGDLASLGLANFPYSGEGGTDVRRLHVVSLEPAPRTTGRMMMAMPGEPDPYYGETVYLHLQIRRRPDEWELFGEVVRNFDIHVELVTDPFGVPDGDPAILIDLGENGWIDLSVTPRQLGEVIHQSMIWRFVSFRERLAWFVAGSAVVAARVIERKLKRQAGESPPDVDAPDPAA